MPTNRAGADVWSDEIQIPSDGDKVKAAAVNVPIEGVQDNTLWLRNRGVPKVYEFGIVTGVTDYTLFQASTTSTTLAYTSTSPTDCIDIASCEVDDWLEVWLDLAVTFTNTGDRGFIYINRLENLVNPVGFSLAVKSVVADVAGAYPYNLALHGVGKIATAGTCRVRIGYSVDNGSGAASAGAMRISRVVHGTVKRTKEPPVHP